MFCFIDQMPEGMRISVTFLAIHIISVYRRICKCRYNQIKAIFKSAYYCCIDTFIGLKSNAHVLRTGENEVQMDEALRAESKKPLEKMLDLAK